MQKRNGWTGKSVPTDGLVGAGRFLGSKILYLLTRLPDILANPALLGSSIKDGFVVYGGIIGGILTAWITANVRNGTFGNF